MKNLLLIMNPYSGKKIGRRYLADILEKFCLKNYIPRVMLTTRPGHGMELAETYGGEADLVVCMGGDGTFNEVVSGLMKGKHQVPLGYIPCGSTNDFANSIGLSKNLLTSADRILSGTATPYDIGLFGQRYFTYVASFGLFTRASYATPQNAKNTLGHIAYVLEGIKDLSNIRPWHLRFETNAQVFEDDYIFGAVSNSTSVGGVLTLDPERVDMQDGLFELLLIKMPKSPAELNDCIMALLEQDYDSPVLTFCSTDRLTVTAQPDMEWTLDGEWCPGSEKIEVRNIHNAIRLVR